MILLLITGFTSIVFGLMIGWYSKQVLSVLQSTRYQIIKFIRKPLSMLDADPLADIRIGKMVTPAPPTMIDDPNDPYNG